MPGFKKHKIIMFLSTGDRECTDIDAKDESAALFQLQQSLERCLKEGRFYVTIPDHVCVNPKYVVKIRNNMRPRKL
jgi:hypothetical protein